MENTFSKFASSGSSWPCVRMCVCVFVQFFTLQFNLFTGGICSHLHMHFVCAHMRTRAQCARWRCLDSFNCGAYKRAQFSVTFHSHAFDSKLYSLCVNHPTNHPPTQHTPIHSIHLSLDTNAHTCLHQVTISPTGARPSRPHSVDKYRATLSVRSKQSTRGHA